ncbi:MAG TPA: hypothetical protein VII73_00840 [Caulobacteraceae bacterium]
MTQDAASSELPEHDRNAIIARNLLPQREKVGGRALLRLAKRCTPVVWLAALLIVMACEPDQSELHIVRSVPMADGKLRAIYLEDTQGGPATGVGEDVYVVKGDGPFRYSDRVFDRECVTNVQLEWIGSQTLQITYEDGDDDLAHDGSDAKPWWSLNRSPPYGVTLRIIRHIHHRTTCA